VIPQFGFGQIIKGLFEKTDWKLWRWGGICFS
jgi:hypothetical protein